MSIKEAGGDFVVTIIAVMAGIILVKFLTTAAKAHWPNPVTNAASGFANMA